MAHLRPRSLSEAVKKQLKFWPILTILGPRQSGKSTFLREIALPQDSFSYVSLDRIAARDAANRNPENFLLQFEKYPLIIDEAHKAPPVFDEIKAVVDENRRPGRFILTGSVRFSSKLGIRESFTGRVANLKFDSMTVQETLQKKPTLKELHRYLKMGGMPAVCFLRDTDQIQRYWTEWLETTFQRDLQEMGKGRLSGDLAYQILESVCILELPNSAEIAAKLRVDARRVRTHLEALENLFLIRPWDPSPGSVGKTLYLPFDCGMAQYFQAPLRRIWQTAFAHQTLNQARFDGKPEPKLQYNLTARGSFCDFVIDKEAILFNDEAYPSPRTMIRVQALEKRLPKYRITVASQTDQPPQKISKKTQSRPWCDWF